MQVHHGRGLAGAVRALVIGSFVLGASAALAGCGGSDAPGSASAGTAAAAASSPGAAASPSAAVSGDAVTAQSPGGSPSRAGGGTASAGAGKASGAATQPSGSAAGSGSGGSGGGGGSVPAADPGGKLVSASHPVTSPSGRYSAALAPSAVTGGVQTYVVVIRDAAGKEVFRNRTASTADQGLAVAWLSTGDQLWLQSEVATSHVDLVGSAWKETAITPATVDTIPAEIKALTD